MRKIILTSAIIFFYLSVFSQSADKQVANCLNTSDLFLLEEIYPTLTNEIETPMLKTFAESLLYTTFNEPEQAIETIDSLISKYQGEIGLDNVKNMFIFQNWLFFRQGEYQNAYNRLKSLIDQLEAHMPADFFTDIRGNLKLNEAFLGEQKPQLIRPDIDCIVPFEIDTIQIKGNEHDTLRHSTLMFIPVTVNEIQERFIFDTGCGGGIFLSQEYAERLGVRIRMDSLNIRGAIGQEYGQMGILDSLQVGNMTFKNVTVTITPPNPQVDTLYRIDAVLGVDLMVFSGEVQIFPQKKEIVFPVNKTSLPVTGRNMMRIPGGDGFFLKTYSGDERLIMLLDTGNAYSNMNGNYYENHKEFVHQNGTKSRKITGGIGGLLEKEFYSIPSFPLKVGNQLFEISDIIIETDADLNPPFENGALGMAFINTFNKVTISFDKMFVEVE